MTTTRSPAEPTPAKAILAHPSESSLRRPSVGPRFDTITTLAAMLMVTISAAMPASDVDDDAAAARSANTPSSAVGLRPGEFAFGAYLGAPYHYPSDFRLRKNDQHDLTVRDVEWFTEPFDNPVYYGARIQRWLTGGRFGTMIDFVHSKAIAPKDQEAKLEGTLNGEPVPETGKIRDFFKKLEFSHGHNMLTLNGLMRLGSLGAVQPYVGGGAGISIPHSEMHLSSDPHRTYEYQYTGPTAQALFGLEWRLKTGSVFIEYKFTIADYLAPITHVDGSWLPLDAWRQISRWWRGEEPSGGWGETQLASHQVVGGFTVRFAPRQPVAAP